MTSPIDRLSGLLEQFRIETHLLDAGPLRGARHYPADVHGHLHVVRGGALRVRHAPGSALPAEVRVDGPSVLLYPRPAAHDFLPGTPRPQTTCAALTLTGGGRHPLLQALPPLIHLPVAQVDGLGPALDLLGAETERVRCGQRLLADHLLGVVLIQLLRWLFDHPDEAGVAPGLVAAFADPRLARALVAVHEAPAERWTLERMARRAGMSRTAFATTFKQLMGQTPAGYLARWRIGLAQQRLRQGDSLTRLAGDLGYASASALSRAFSAQTGLSPRAWLGQQRVASRG